MSHTAAVSMPEILAHLLVFAIVAYIAAVPGALACAAWNVAVQPRRSVAPNAGPHLLGEALTAT
jgi:hypothetical protein